MQRRTIPAEKPGRFWSAYTEMWEVRALYPESVQCDAV